MKTPALALLVGVVMASAQPGGDTPEPGNTIVSPAQAACQPGKTCIVRFKVGTTARVTDITDRESHRLLEVLLVDAPNGDYPTTPVERAGIVIRIPESARPAFGARSMGELARRFEGHTVLATGEVEIEPHPLRHHAQGRSRPRARITVTDPAQLRIGGQP